MQCLPFWIHSQGSAVYVFLAPRSGILILFCKHVLALQGLPAKIMRAKAQGSATASPTPGEPGAASPPSDHASAQVNGAAGTPLGGVQAAAAQQMPKAPPDEADGELQCIRALPYAFLWNTKRAHAFAYGACRPRLCPASCSDMGKEFLGLWDLYSTFCMMGRVPFKKQRCTASKPAHACALPMLCR